MLSLGGECMSCWWCRIVLCISKFEAVYLEYPIFSLKKQSKKKDSEPP